MSSVCNYFKKNKCPVSIQVESLGVWSTNPAQICNVRKQELAVRSLYLLQTTVKVRPPTWFYFSQKLSFLERLSLSWQDPQRLDSPFIWLWYMAIRWRLPIYLFYNKQHTRIQTADEEFRCNSWRDVSDMKSTIWGHLKQNLSGGFQQHFYLHW